MKYWKTTRRLFALTHLLLVFGVACSLWIFGCKTPFLKSHSVDVAKVLEGLPECDKESLEWFFRSLKDAGCSYVLFGNKPMSICSFLEVEPHESKIFRFHEFMGRSFDIATVPQIRAYRGWQTWNKYKHFFPSSKFILLENLKPGWITITIINKQCFLKIIAENIDVFREVLGAQITAEKILDNCLKANDIFDNVLHCHDGLYGLLLGYGRHNALLFSRRSQIENLRESQKYLLARKLLSPSEGFSTIDEEHDSIKERLDSFDESQGDDFNPLLMHLPGFMAEQAHPETQQLKIEYKEQYKSIIQKYKKGNFLEITLNQFVDSAQ